MPAVTFPVWGVSEGKCMCGVVGCDRAGKHPKEKWRALTHSVEKGLEDNQGLIVGDLSGVVVLDIDRKNGVDGLKTLQEGGFEVPVTFTVSTPTGGFHYYFKHPGFKVRSGSWLGKGIDIKADGGHWVVAPGSRGKNHKRYEVIDSSDLAPLPDWFLQHPGLKPRRGREFVGSPVEPVPPGEKREKHIQEFIKVCQEAPPAVSGQKGHTALWMVAMKGVLTWQLPMETAADLILQYYNPRCEPPWSEKDVRYKVESAAKTGKLTVGPGLLLWDPKDTKKEVKDPCQLAPKPGKKVPQSTADLVRMFSSHPDWSGVFSFEVMREEVRVLNPPLLMDSYLSSTAITAIQCWLEYEGGTASRDSIKDAADIVARKNNFSMVQRYLELLPPESPEFLDGIAARIFGPDVDDSLDFVKKTLVGAVRRALQPGCDFQTVLMLKGAQNIGKSTLIKTLFDPVQDPLRPLTRSNLPDLQNRDGSHALLGMWGVEVGELVGFRTKETTDIKEYISRSIDQYRQFQTGDLVVRPRYNVFVGTTNEETMLQDASGNRRFWVLDCPGVIDIDWVETNRDRIWAAALALAQSGYSHRLNDRQQVTHNEENRKYERFDEWEHDIAAFLKDKREVLTKDVFLQSIVKGQVGALEKLTHGTSIRISNILKKLGWKQKVTKVDGRSVRLWEKP